MRGISRTDLERWTHDFTQAFNDQDLDRVMSYFAEDGVYDQYDDELAEGLAAIRAAFEPQFNGAFGDMRFEEEDFFVDAETRKCLIAWVCSLDTREGRAGWRGLDILVFNEDGKIARKATYAKAKTLQLRPHGSQPGSPGRG
jgi:ketosteroid isomerase-like protein